MENSYEVLAASVGIGTMVVSYVISLIILILTLVGYWKMFVKAGKPGWASIIPFYNMYCMYDIAWGSGWMFLLTFVPCVNFVITIMMCFKLAKAYGQGTGFGFGLLFFPTIFALILGFGKAEYVGPQ